MSLGWPRRRKQGRFAFAPRWKEMMIVTGPGGSFTLDFWMGNPTVSLPPEERWVELAPAWAAGLWCELHAELVEWCGNNSAALEIDSRAGVY